MSSLFRSKFVQLILLGGILFSFTAADKPDVQSSPIAADTPIKQFSIIAHPSINTYTETSSGPDGMAFQIINHFAQAHGYAIEVIIAEDEDQIYHALNSGLADIALVGRPLSISKQNEYPQSQSYMDITTQLIYKHGEGKPESFEDLLGKKVVVQDNEQFREKYAFIKEHYPKIEWQFSSLSTEELLGMVNTGTIDYTLVDSHNFLRLAPIYTRTRVAFDLYYPEPITLALSRQANPALIDQLNLFIDASMEDGTMNQLTERFYGHVETINPRGSMTFFKRVRTRLPHYQDMIERIAKEYDLDWRLLAAIAYQESHWNPRAKSNTGVRGMMMLTQATAKDLGIENRLDAEESLRGGAIYLQSIMKRLPDSIQYPDRTWFALAAYNVGLGHIYDARKITEFHGGNPDRWADLQQYLPLLEKEEWYEYTQYGFARGSEPVKYVHHIRHFNDLLHWRFPDESYDEVVPEEQSPTIISVQDLDTAEKKKQASLTLPANDVI